MNDTDGSIICRKLAHDFMCLLERLNRVTAELATRLCTQLQKVINNACKSGHNKPKRSCEEIFTKSGVVMFSACNGRSFWRKIKYQAKNKMPNEPIFYQHFTFNLFEGIHKPVLDGYGCTNDTATMTYEEDALRYIVRNLSQSSSVTRKRMNYKLYVSYMGMKQQAEESEQWTASADCEGLVYINTMHFNFCQLSSTVYSLICT